MPRFNDETTAAKDVLARVDPDGLLGPDAAADLAALMRRETDADYTDTIDDTADHALAHLQDRAGPPFEVLHPRNPEHVRAVVAGYRSLAAWCWLARWELQRARARDYIMLVAENDGDAYRMMKKGPQPFGAKAAATTAVNRAWQDAVKHRGTPDAVEILDGVEIGDIAPECIDALARRWGETK